MASGWSELSLSSKVTDDIGVLSLTGSLNSRTRVDVECILRDWLHADVLRIAIRCAQLDQVDSAGLSALLAVIPRVRPRGGDIVLVDLGPRVKALFQVASIRQFFKSYSSMPEAMQYLGSLHVAPGAETAPENFDFPGAAASAAN